MADALRRWVLGAAEQQLQQLVATCEPMEEFPGELPAINSLLPWLTKVKRLQLVQVRLLPRVRVADDLKIQFTSVPTPETPQSTAQLVVSDKQSTLNAILASDCVQSYV